VSKGAYKKAIESILVKKKKPEKKKLPAIVQSPSENLTDEPVGFIGQYSKKLT
jgi:hypothetical protein